MDIKFVGKRALVTGGGSGIGRAIAKALWAAGAKTFVASKIQAELDTLKPECPGMECLTVDLGDWAATRKAIESFGPIDLLVNNAGINVLQSFLDVTEGAYDSIMNVNVKAALNVSQVVARGMVERKTGGAIVNIASQAAIKALRDHTVYSTSKAALIHMTNVMALELGPHKIRCNCVCPTVVMTELGREAWSSPEKGGPMLQRIPLGRFAEIEDVVNPVLYLLSDKAAMLNGVALPVDGGFVIG